MESSNAFWYEKTQDSEIAESLFAQIECLKSLYVDEITEDQLLNVSLYGGSEFYGMAPHNYSKKPPGAGISGMPSLNIIKQACNTATAKIAKSKPRPQFLTSLGDYRLKREAKKLQRYVDGTFYENKAYQMGQKVFRDATIVGKGCVKFFPKGGKISMERVFLSELFVDQADAFYGNPSILYQKKAVNRRTLLGMYPGKASIIKMAPTVEDYAHTAKMQSEIVEVVEAWVLPSSTGSKDGLHVISVSGGLLFREKWDEDWFPFEFIDWDKDVLGWYSSGIASELRGTQREINKLLLVIQRAMHLGAVPKVYVDANTKIVKSHFNNEIGSIITYLGQRPFSDQLLVIPPVLFQRLQDLYNKGFEIVGLSQLSATGQKPAGLDSGKALRTFNDIETERFSIIAQAYDQFFVDMSTKLILMSERESKKKGSELKVTSFGSKFVEEIRWSDIDIRRDQYILKTFPTNFLSTTPEGKLSDISDLAALGVIDQREIIALLDYPDLEGVTEFKNAQFDDIFLVLENIVDKGEYEPPMPYQALDFGKKLFQQVYVKMKNQNLEPERLEMLLRWDEDATLLQSRAVSQQTQTVITGDTGSTTIQAGQPEVQGPASGQAPAGV